MDTSQVSAKAAALRAQAAPLGQLASQVAQTREAARHPERHGIEPGEKTIAPWSIESLAGIRADLVAAQASMNDLIARAVADIEAQKAVSSASGGITVATTASIASLVSKPIDDGGSSESLPKPTGDDLKDPAKVAEWWNSLSDAEQREYIEDHPEEIGNLEGVSYAARSEANKALLDSEIARLKDVQSRYADAEYPWEAAGILADTGMSLADVNSRLEAAQAIKDTLAPGEIKGATPRQLISFNLDGDAKAVIAVGDLDTADNISVMVPGMDSTVATSMEGLGTAADILRKEQIAVGNKGEDYATVAWLGYDTPKTGEVIYDQWAKDGGTLLADDLEGIGATKGWGDKSANLDVVGVSYGSSVAFDALTKSNAAGSLIALGSVGPVKSGIDSAGELGVPVYASESPNDGVADWGRWLADRKDPLDDDFGSIEFESDGSSTLIGTTDHGGLLNLDDRSKYGYLDAGTESVRNIALITTGKYVAS
jgi:hypothetical protein